MVTPTEDARSVPTDWPSCKHLLIEREGSMAVVTLHRPDAANALNTELCRELLEVVSLVGLSEEVHAIVLTGGEGRVFCAGADLKERYQQQGREWELRRPLVQLWKALWLFPKPVVVGVNGHAVGGGLEILFLADAVIASHSAEFWYPEVQWAGIPGGWATQLLPRLVGPVLARWLILSGRHLTASDALRCGIVTEVVPPERVRSRAIEMAAELARRPAMAVALAKEAVRQAFEVPLSAGMALEDRLVQLAVAAPERRVQLARFAERGAAAPRQ